MKKTKIINRLVLCFICSLFLFFVSVVSAVEFVKNGVCYYASTQFGEDASTMATIHFTSESSNVYALLTTEDDTTFSKAVRVELEHKLVDYTAPLAKNPDVPLKDGTGLKTNPDGSKVDMTGNDYFINFNKVAYECTGRLTDLTPGTKYMWKATDDTNTSEVFHFATATGKSDRFTFSYTTDSQNYTDGARWDRYNAWSDNIFKTAAKNEMEISFVMNGGDIVEWAGNGKYWSYFFQPDYLKKVAFVPTPGNHDYTATTSSGGTDGRFFASQFGNPLNGAEGIYEENNYFFKYNDTLFMILTSFPATGYQNAQYEWLDKVMKENPAQYKVVCVHYPVNTDAVDTSKAYIPVLQKYNVDLVLFGHTHTYAVQQNYYDRRKSNDEFLGTTYISASSPEGDYGNPVVTQMFFTFTDTMMLYKGYTPESVQKDSIPFTARRIPTEQSLNDYNEEQFVQSFSFKVDSSTYKTGKFLFDDTAYNDVYRIALKDASGKVLGEKFITDSKNCYINVSGLTPETNYNAKVELEYYDGSTKEFDYSFNTNVVYGQLESLKEGMSAYGYRLLYTPSFRSEVKSLEVYLDGEKVSEAAITDKKIIVDKELLTENKKYVIEIKGVLNDGRIVPIYSTTYGEDQEVQTFKVTFVANEAVISEVQVEEGKGATAPEAPAIEGFVFDGWDKDFSNVTSDIVVKAKYKVATYTVKFLDKDGKEISTQTVEHGKDANAPTAPLVPGFAFKAWDKEFTNVKADLEVKAVYEEVKAYKVKFLDKDGNVISEVQVEEGKDATAPTAPAVDGYVFKGWDKEFTNVKADLEVKAVYEQAKKEFTVKFLDKDGKVISEVKVEEGKDAKAPTAPTVDGFEFKGWDKEFANVQADLEVKALYEEVKKSGCNSASIIFTSLMLLGLCFIRRRKF